MVKKYLQNHIKDNTPDEEVAVLLSGGVDSISVALSAHSVGKKVIPYTFHLINKPSYDSQTAKTVSDMMGWKLNTIEVPTENLVDDWYKLVKLGCKKKTHFECVFPFLYIYPEIKEKYVLTGWGADGYFGVSKKAMMRYSNDKKWDNYTKYCKEHNQKQLTFNEFREAYFSENECAGLKWHNFVVAKYNKIHITPYLDKKVKTYLMKKDWQELNKPRQKEIIRKDFTKLKKFGIIKEHQNLHLGSEVDKLFKTLLNNPTINFKERKRMMDVSRDWYEKEKNGILPL